MTDDPSQADKIHLTNKKDDSFTFKPLQPDHIYNYVDKEPTYFKFTTDSQAYNLTFSSAVGPILTITREGNLIFAEHLSKNEAAVEFLKCLNQVLTYQGLSAKFEIKDETDVG